MIKATLITILIYWILKIIGRWQYKSLSELGKLRYETYNFKTGEATLLSIIAIARTAAYIMAFATAFYMIFKYL